MTEQERLRGLLLLSAMTSTIDKMRRDFEEMQKAADEFRADMADVLLRLRSDKSTGDRGNGLGDREGHDRHAGDRGGAVGGGVVDFKRMRRVTGERNT